MTADRRNAIVVIALLSALTLGISTLWMLEPARSTYAEAPLLMAERGARPQTVAVDYIADAAQAAGLLQQDGPETVCLILPDAQPQLGPEHGGRVRVVVAGSGGDVRLSDEQSRKVLGALAQFRAERVQLEPGLDDRQNPNLPQEARDLLRLLKLKRFVDPAEDGRERA